MKNPNKYRFLILVFLGLFLTSHVSMNAQQTKKNKIRINANYTKIMDGAIHIDVKSSARIDKKNTPVGHIELIIFNLLDDDKINLGKVKTNDKGEGRFTLKDINAIKADSTNSYHIQVAFKGNDSFTKAQRNISFKDVNIRCHLIQQDSINYVEATLIDGITQEPIEGELLTVQIERLFFPLQIGDEFNETDDQGKILVPIEEGIPGVNGNLNVEVVLNESDDYGTVKGLVTGHIGIPILDESTFDQRTMWSPRNKTPFFLLVFPNLIILGIWGILIYLIFNLVRISKI